jgi:hypothetical protein
MKSTGSVTLSLDDDFMFCSGNPVSVIRLVADFCLAVDKDDPAPCLVLPVQDRR